MACWCVVHVGVHRRFVVCLMVVVSGYSGGLLLHWIMFEVIYLILSS